MVCTVYFNGQFWIAVVEDMNGGVLRAVRHIFGPSEPSDPEVFAFVNGPLPTLLAEAQVGVYAPDADHRRINPKRLQRQVRRELATSGPSRYAHKAMQAQLEERKRVRRKDTKNECEAFEERKRLLAREKAKAKHRGH